MNVILVIVGCGAFALLLFGLAAIYDARASHLAGTHFGAGAGVHVAQLRHSSLLADRLRAVRWSSATRVGINPGRFVLNDTGLHWTPSFLTGRKVPAFSVAWTEVRNHEVDPGPKILGRRVAHLTLHLSDGTLLRFATYDPQGLKDALSRLIVPR